ncbi:MAG: UDP-N-acetylmuramoyl-L-alanine--D-glutamate ligase [Anaerolineae bacterium]|nr:UDP-N-acetylmuramoyl-L-alanine--D-glutamate ligase [Anaerolineae bacterium]
MPDPLTDKRVVIMGLARQGVALAKWLCSIGAQVAITDMRTAEQLVDPIKELDGLPISYALGGHPPYVLSGADLICLSGGVSPDQAVIQEAVKLGVGLSNDAQLFLDRCPCDVIGITGSAGKTTTTTLIGKMCEKANRLTWVGGNIGNPLITDLPYIKPTDIVVMELSSFQTEIMTTSPHVAAVLNVTPNHLDRHKTMDAYIEAKARLLDNQVVGDIAVLGYDDPTAASLASRARHELAFFSGRVPPDVGAWLVDDRLMCRPRFEAPLEPVCTTAEINLRGYHNVLNTLAACAIAGVAGIPIEAMSQAILEFKPVAHRLEEVRQVDSVTYINDSIATTPERVIAALQAYPDRTIVLLLGGRDKKLPWDDLLRIAVHRCRAIITFGEAGLMIAQKVDQIRRAMVIDMTLEQADSMEDVVRLASELAYEGDFVLLSPGCTSYDKYADFEERGEHFRELVRRL